MTSNSPEFVNPVPIAAPKASLRALRALAPGLAVALLLVCSLVFIGQAVGVIPGESTTAVWLGLFFALVAVALATIAYVRITVQSPVERDGPLASARLQTLLGAAFVVKLAVLGASFGCLALAGMKFPFLVAFAVAFAGASLVFQLVSVVLLARALADRSRVAQVQSR